MIDGGYEKSQEGQGRRHGPFQIGGSYIGLKFGQMYRSILDIMYAKKPYTVIQRAMHIHPPVSEQIPTLPGDLKPLQ
jgi:hypothetical protein